MPEDSPEVAALKERAARLNAERDVARADLERLLAQKGLTDAQAVPTAAARAAAQIATDKAAAEAQIAVFERQTAAADAQTAAAGAEAAALKARFGSISANTVTAGAVTTESGAGNAEAGLLAALVVQEAAKRIAVAVKGLGQRGFVIYTGSQRPTFNRWRAFREQREMIGATFTTAEGVLGSANAAAANIDNAAVEQKFGQLETVAGLVSIGGAVLDAASKVASFFQSSFNVAGAAITGSDDELLAVAVAGYLPGCFLPSRWLPTANETTIARELADLTGKRDASTLSLLTAKSKAGDFRSRAEAELDANKKVALARVADSYGQAAELLTAAQRSFDEFLATLGVNDKDGVPLAVALLDEKSMLEKLEGGAYALIVRVNAALGGSYTRTSLWTLLGSLPFFVSGGVVVTFLAIDGPTGSVKAAGEFALHSGYQKVNNVAKQFQSPTISPCQGG